MSTAHTFTLIELLVVIAIIAILAAILLPALNSARQRGMAADCLSRHKQCGLSLLSYADNFDGYLPHAIETLNGTNVSWALNLYQQGLLAGNPEDSDPDNKQVFRCPSIVHTSGTAVNWKERTFGMRLSMDKTAPYANKRIALKAMNGTSTVMIIADSMIDTKLKQYCAIDGGTAYWYGGNFTSNQCVMAAHNGMINMTFLDGHAAGMRPEEFLQVERSRWRDPYDKHHNNKTKPGTLWYFDSNFNKQSVI